MYGALRHMESKETIVEFYGSLIKNPTLKRFKALKLS